MQLDMIDKLFGKNRCKMKEYSNHLPMQLWQEDGKPATKILLKGKMALSDSELLSIIIGNDGSRNRSCLDSAR